MRGACSTISPWLYVDTEDGEGGVGASWIGEVAEECSADAGRGACDEYEGLRLGV